MIEMWSLNKAEETKDEAVKYIADAYEFYNKQWELVGGDN